MISMSYSYLMSPKWISTYGISYDLSDTKNVGQMLRITRVGESMLVSGGFSYDPARNSVSRGLHDRASLHAQGTTEPGRRRSYSARRRLRIRMTPSRGVCHE